MGTKHIPRTRRQILIEKVVDEVWEIANEYVNQNGRTRRNYGYFAEAGLTFLRKLEQGNAEQFLQEKQHRQAVVALEKTWRAAQRRAKRRRLGVSGARELIERVVAIACRIAAGNLTYR